MRSGDPRADFFAVYRKEADEFDKEYPGKYDGGLSTSLIFVSYSIQMRSLGIDSGGAQAGLFSAVSSAFIVDVQSKLEPDLNEITAAYMQILIHAVSRSLFPDANPDSAIWTPPEIVTVQSLLYVSLATSLFAAFLAMLGKHGSIDISGTAEVLLLKRAAIGSENWMDSRSGSFNSLLRASQ